MYDFKVTIVDYGMGNIRSVGNALSYLGCKVEVTDRLEVLKSADVVVLPGVGAFGEAMDNLRRLNLVDEMSRQVMELKKPFLGICLGMQLIAESSLEKGEHHGLGWVSGQVVPLSVNSNLRVPHMGWNEISLRQDDNLLDGFQRGMNFYFVHSYWFQCNNRTDVHSTVDYGGEFTATVRRDNIFATQFHPERSHHNGIRLLKNYLNEVDRLLQA